jgi:hypothetical protein
MTGVIPGHAAGVNPESRFIQQNGFQINFLSLCEEKIFWNDA